MRRLLRVVEEAVLAWSIIGIAAVTIANTAARALWNQSLASTEEISRILIVFVTFFGLSHAAGRGRHIRMSALHDALGPPARRALMIVITAGTSLLLVAMAVYALRYVGSVRATGSVTPVLQIPLHWVYLAAPAGFALAGIQYALAAVRNWLTGEVHLSWDVRDEDEAEAP